METLEKQSYDYYVSYFNTITKLFPKEISLIHFLHSIKQCVYEYRIQMIRNIEDKKERQKIKSSLPAICCSALFSGTRNLQNVTKATGLISIDIDNCNNLAETFNKIKTDKYTFSTFISPSGNGIKVIIKSDCIISNFNDTFYALEKYYKRKYNIEIDPVCKDITRLMFVSSDSNLYINHLAEIFTDKLTPPIKPQPTFKPNQTFNNTNLTEKIINKIKVSHIDITSCYNDWIKIAYSLVNEFGINGLHYFLEISQFYPNFDPTETSNVYKSCLRSGSRDITIASLYKVASWHGISYKD